MACPRCFFHNNKIQVLKKIHSESYFNKGSGGKPPFPTLETELLSWFRRS